MEKLIFGSLWLLALSFFMSISIMAGHHALIFIPTLYFLPKINWKKLTVSNWALIIFSLVLPITIIATANNPVGLKYFNIMKFKYYLFGALMAAPIGWWLKTKASQKQIQSLFWTAFISSSLASLSGMIGLFTGFNPLKWGPPSSATQNAGMFGMLMSYAHNEAIWCLILIGLFLNYKKLEKYFPLWLLYSAFALNFIGFIFAYTRGAMLAFIIALPFYFFKANKKKFLSAIAITTIIAGGIWLTVPKVKEIFTSRQHSNLLRIGQWQAAMKTFELHPIMGVGFRNFQPYSTIIKKEYGYPEPTWEGHAHNNILEIAAGTGLVGLIPFLVWMFGWFIESYKRDDLAAKIAFPCIIAIFIGGLTQNTITDGVNAFLFMLLYALTQIEVDTRPQDL